MHNVLIIFYIAFSIGNLFILPELYLDLTYMGVEVSAEDMQKLGMAVEPKMYNGQLMIKCTKPGVAHITVKAVGGGNRPGTGSVMGGIEITKTFAVIARETGAENGGWL